MRTENCTITVGGAATGNLNASFNSDPLRIDFCDLLSITATVSGSASLNGTIKLQACNDPGWEPGTGMKDTVGLTNWVDVAGMSITITADGSNMFDAASVAWRWARIVYTRTAGTGTLAIQASAKSRA